MAANIRQLLDMRQRAVRELEKLGVAKKVYPCLLYVTQPLVGCGPFWGIGLSVNGGFLLPREDHKCLVCVCVPLSSPKWLLTDIHPSLPLSLPSQRTLGL